MAVYPKEIALAVGQTGPDIVMNVFKDDKGTTKDGTGATAVKFQVRNLDTDAMVVTDGEATLLQANPMKLKRVIGTETADEVKNGAAWFEYTLNSKTEKTTAVGFTVTEPWKRRG